jgi:hypothetical protein
VEGVGPGHKRYLFETLDHFGSQVVAVQQPFADHILHVLTERLFDARVVGLEIVDATFTIVRKLADESHKKLREGGVVLDLWVGVDLVPGVYVWDGDAFLRFLFGLQQLPEPFDLGLVVFDLIYYIHH